MDCCQKWEKYFKKNPIENALVNILLGMGIGFLLAYPVIGVHPVRWGLVFVALGLIGNLWATK